MVRNWKKTASMAYGYAMVRLALNLFLYFEELPAEYEEGMGHQRELDARFMELLGWYLDGEYDRILEELDEFRRQIRQEMETVVAYSDAFQIYEYVWKRLERRFDKDIPPLEMDEEALVGRLMHYLSQAGDAAVMNQRVQEILQQLPVRYTRQKYFGIVHDALTTYVDGDHAGLEEIMYLLRSGSMIEYSRRKGHGYESLDRRMEQLKGISFKELTGEGYQSARQETMEAGEMLTALLEYCSNLGEMANDLYILCLAGPEAVRDAAKERAVHEILSGIRTLYEQNSRKIPEELFAYLPELEGIQEEYYERYQQLSFRQEEASEEDETDRLAARVELLMSSSIFFEMEGEQKRGSVTREEMEAEAAAFFADLKSTFASCQKPVMRAIMAITLSYLPIHFQSAGELQNHIRNSLSCCTDSAEKETCMKLLQLMMERDGYELV